MIIRLLTISCVFTLWIVPNSLAQQFAGEEVWKELFVHDGIRFLYIFYPSADALNDGVVMMLQNQNDHHVQYKFTIVFESPEGTTFADVSGFMEPREIITGDSDGLFWIPFDDERSLGAIRIRNYKIAPVDAQADSPICDSLCMERL